MRLLVVCVLAWLSVVTGFSIASAPLRSRARALAVRSGRPEAAVRDISSNDEFDEAIKSAGDSLVVVDYSTSWCGPCKIIAPKFDEFSEQYKNVAFLKVRALPPSPFSNPSCLDSRHVSSGHQYDYTSLQLLR